MRTEISQGDIFTGFRPEQTVLSFDEAKDSVLEQLEKFLNRCTSGDDLGLRLRGEQLAVGVRFICVWSRKTRMIWWWRIPLYQGSSNLQSMTNTSKKIYPDGKSRPLQSLFIQRRLTVNSPLWYCRHMITMRGWMFIKQYEGLRKWLTKHSSPYHALELTWKQVHLKRYLVSVVINCLMSVFHRCDLPQEATHSEL